MTEFAPDDLEMAKAGDLAAFERILSVFEKPIFSYAYRLLGDRGDAEDATQETFIKFYKNLARLDAGQPLKSWLYAVATNTAYDILRKKKYIIEVGLEEAEHRTAETEIGEDPYYQAGRQFDAEIIQKHLLGLKPIQRAVILLYYYKGLGIEEISQITSLPPGTVKTHLHRGRQELKQLIQKFYEH